MGSTNNIQANTCAQNDINANSTQRGPQGIPGEAATIQLGTVTTGAAGSDVIITNSGTENAAVFNFTIPRGDRGEQGEQGIQGETGNGIASVELTSTSGLVDTYTITFTNGNTTTFNVTNGQDGNGIASIQKTSTSGLVDTYTITFDNGNTETFTVTNGQKGDTGSAATISVGSTTTGAAGTNASVTNSGTTSDAVLDFVIPQGVKGDTGATGADGFSPTATVTKSGDTATITITDKNGTTTATVSDGSGANSISQLTDVDLTGLSNGDVLVYDSTSQEWKAEAQSGGVTDVEVNGTSVVTDGVAEIDLSHYQTTIEAGENIRITQPADIRVPEGYTQLERINSTSGACCIDTGLTGAIKWEIDVLGNSPYPAKRALIATDGNGSAFFGQYSGSSAWGTNGNSTGVSIADRINLVINFTTTGCNGTINGTSFSYSATGNLSTNWVLFGTSNYGTRLYGYLYSAKATQNGLVVFDGVPAVRDSDHVSGLYDVVSGNFFTSATTTEFSAGSILSTNTVVSADVGNGTLTISRYGTTLATFTANQTGNTTANMTNPAIQPKEIGASSILNSSTTKAVNSLLYCGNDNLVHSYTETNVPISMAYGMFVNSSQLTANSSISYYYRGEKLGWSVPSAMRIFTARHKVWARCTYPDSNGNVYFVSLYDQNGSANTLQGGYTYYYLGCASSTSTIALDVTGSHFLSINTDGKLTHIDGVEVTADLSGKADVDLSNLTTTSSPNLDGQWVQSHLVVSSTATSGARSHDLSSYLPNDGYDYEVMFWVYVEAGSNYGSVTIGTVASPYTNRTDGFNTVAAVISGGKVQCVSTIIPISTGRTLYSQNTTGFTSVQIQAFGYRRIGTNS